MSTDRQVAEAWLQHWRAFWPSFSEAVPAGSESFLNDLLQLIHQARYGGLPTEGDIASIRKLALEGPPPSALLQRFPKGCDCIFDVENLTPEKQCDRCRHAVNTYDTRNTLLREAQELLRPTTKADHDTDCEVHDQPDDEFEDEPACSCSLPKRWHERSLSVAGRLTMELEAK